MEIGFARWIAFPAIAFVALVACVNIHVYLYDEEQAKEVAQKLVRDIRSESLDSSSGEAAEPDMESEAGTDDGAFLFLRPFASSVAWAQEIDITKENPQIRTLHEQLKKLDSQLHPFFDAGLIGEATTGMVVFRVDEKEVDPRKRAQIRKIMNEVNELRTKLYREVIRSQDVDVDDETMATTEKLFAEEWRKWTRKGWYYMDPKKKKWVQQEKTLEERNLQEKRPK